MSTTTTRPGQIGTADVTGLRNPEVTRRGVQTGVTIVVAAAIMAWFWLSLDDGRVKVGTYTTTSKPATVDATLVIGVALGLAVLSLLLVVVGTVVQKLPQWLLTVVALVVGVGFFASFLLWVFADNPTGFSTAPLLANPLPETITLATPLILGALAGCLGEKAGVINIAIEGQFIVGAFFAAVAASLAYNKFLLFESTSGVIGLVGGVLAGVLLAAMLAWFAMRFQVNQVVLGVVLVLFATGLTSFLLDQIPDGDWSSYLNEPPTLEPIAIPGLSGLPIVGEALFNQTLLVYVMYASILLVTFLLFATRWGLRVRSVGEHPKAADTVGIKVNRVRWQAVLLGGVFAGLGGAYFTVGSTGTFDKDQTAGNGFIALAAVIMGRWHPVYASLAALFFGFMTSLQPMLQLRADRIPPELVAMAPYLATIIAVAGFVGRVRPPAADGEPYVKG